MATMQCETCGNHYDKAFELVLDGQRHVFDSFECAIERVAPRCAQCNCRVIGHGVEEGDQIYCCRSCAAGKGQTRLRDRA